MANFSFLASQKEYIMFAPACLEAEKVLHSSPAMCAIGCRKALELAVKWVYAVDNTMQTPYKDNLQALIHETSFRYAINPRTWSKLPYIVKLGNLAVHTDKTISASEAEEALRSLFEFVQWIDYSYGKDYHVRNFDNKALPTAQIIVDVKKVKEQESLLAEKQAEIEKYQKELASYQTELSALKVKNQESRVFEPLQISEWETRKRYIDLDLKLMGWNLSQNVAEEYEVDNMAGIAGQKGYVDYVLFGKEGIPLALIEAKRTSKDPNVGKQQAKLYADCLEQKFGRRPIMFTTNGFETYFWDDCSSPQRPVFSVFSQDDLQKLVSRRTERRKLLEIPVKDNITNRYYQKEAIKAVCEHVEAGYRKALLVMATGTGKTRTAISLVDVLTRGNYATNILFLADRTALVEQAKEAFQQHLPNLSLCNLLSNKDNKNARAVFSTYPTILNSIDGAKTKDGQILFTPAHFDLIIVDEAHRSIFKKYKAIFDYFDAIVVGLTATPKTEVDRNTYDFFEMEQNVPTYAYDYETAVYTDEVLVPYYNIEVKTKFLTDGIVYDELSDKDKEKYEEDFEEEGTIPDFISPEKLNKFIFNQDTVDKVLQDLMTNGIKVRGGDLIGKTIIFAQRKEHAQYIIERFEKLYPQYHGKLAKRVICDDAYAQTIINEFKNADDFPQIVVSVDMLDTGIDVPEVVNLVFFKKVRSKAKFWQMIGRGTRLCENLYCSDGQNGEYRDKKYFYIFDYLGNFEFFRTNKNGIEGSEVISLTESIFSKRVKLIYSLQASEFINEEYQNFRNILVENSLSAINKLNKELFAVHQQRKYVDTFSDKNKFIALSEDECSDLIKYIAPLVSNYDRDENALQFDNFIYAMMIAQLEKSKKLQTYCKKLVSLATSLTKKATIPQIAQKLDFIKSIEYIDFVMKSNILDLERIRQELRDLVKFLTGKKQKIIITNIKDAEIERKLGEGLVLEDDFQNYKDKVNQYILKHTDYLAIYKLRNNKPLTKDEFAILESILTNDLGNKEDYQREFGDTPLGILVRKIAKMERSAAMEVFSKFINDQSLTQQQIVFVNKIIDYIVQNGYIETAELIKAPFDRPTSFVKLFDKDRQLQIVQTIDMLNKNAMVACG